MNKKPEPKTQANALEAMFAEETGLPEPIKDTPAPTQPGSQVTKPRPGSKEAIQAGCKCPIIDNKYGDGAYNNTQTGEPMYWVSDLCELHRRG